MAASDNLDEDSKEATRLVFIGSPLLDMRVSGFNTEAYGLRPDDCIRATTAAHHQLLKELFQSGNLKTEAGGSALISAKFAKWVLGDRGRVSFAGCVGNDDVSPKLRQDLASNKVEPLLESILEQPTGMCACLLSPNGQRSMVTRQGAASFFDLHHLKAETIQRRLREAYCIFVVGYFAGHSPQVIRALADSCSSTQLFSLSLSSEYVCREYTSVVIDVLPRVDILFSNEAEIRALAAAIQNTMHQKNITIEDAVHAVVQLCRLSDSRPRILLITRGPEPLILSQGKDSLQYFSVPRDNVHVVDSVGCGDALAGAFLAAYSLTKDVVRAVNVGIQAAVRKSQVHGCELPSDTILV